MSLLPRRPQWWERDHIPAGNITIAAGTSSSAFVYPPQLPDVVFMAGELHDHPAFKATVETLENLWLQKYGNEWVDVTELERDDFFRAVYARLRKLAKVEVHYLTDQGKYVCRKPE